MNYNKIYDSMISNAKSRPIPQQPTERHHIIPKCMGGSNDKENIVRLTLREHFLAHWLLFKMHPQNYKLLCAWNMFCADSNGTRPTSKNYHYARKNFIEYTKNMKTINPSAYLKRVQSNTETSWMNDGHGNKRVKSDSVPEFLQKGYVLGRLPFTRNNDKNQYIKASETLKSKYKNGYKSHSIGRKQPLAECEFCKRKVPHSNYKQWHGNKCKSSPNYVGKTQTPEQIIRKTHKSERAKNTLWINKEGVNKRVLKEAYVSFYQLDGWILGRSGQ